MKNHSEQVNESGFAIIPNVIELSLADALSAEIQQLQLSQAVKQRGGKAFGIRRLLEVVPAVRTLAESEILRSLVEPALGKNAKVTRGIFFDKNPVANWKVPWHQDVMIALQAKKEAAGFSAWSTKAGVVHAQPPVEILQSILAIRHYLDDTDENNGALRVIPGSHKFGLLADEEINKLKENTGEVTCVVTKGGALLLRPLLLHASSAAILPTHRRVLHLEYSAHNLPDGLEWYGS